MITQAVAGRKLSSCLPEPLLKFFSRSLFVILANMSPLTKNPQLGTENNSSINIRDVFNNNLYNMLRVNEYVD